MNLNQNQDWLDSKSARKALKISACELSHIREAGKLQFQRRGNAYLYSRAEVLHLEKSERFKSHG